jgi:SsrA-binding protein
VHKREIENLRGRLTMRGYALVPLQVYFKNGVAKVQLGLGRGKKKGDERDSIRKQEDLKEARAAMRRQKG